MQRLAGISFRQNVMTAADFRRVRQAVENNPPGCGPDGGPACFVGGLVLAVGAGGDGQGLGNGSVIIESMTGSPVPEPLTWAMIAIGFVGLGFMGRRGSRKLTTLN